MSLVLPSSQQPRAPTVLVRSRCWSCGASIERKVQRRSSDHRHLSWSCPSCDTSWSGPGD